MPDFQSFWIVLVGFRGKSFRAESNFHAETLGWAEVGNEEVHVKIEARGTWRELGQKIQSFSKWNKHMIDLII